jgi:hypothetical protein
MSSATAIHHVFVDFENVHEIDFEVLGNAAVRFTLLVGASQKKLDVDLVEQLLRYASSTELVRMQTAGRNALDIVLAYHLGRAAAAHPGGQFHIVSKDTGFEPLIDHLKSNGISASRHPDYVTLKEVLPPTLGLTPFPAEVDAVVTCLKKDAFSRPKTRKALISYLRSATGKHLSAPQIEKAIKFLQEIGFLEIDNRGAITYRVPSNGHIERFPLEDSDESDDNIEIPDDDDIPF